MNKRILLSAAVAVVAGGFLSTPVLAAHCPKDAKLINAAAATLGKEKMTMAQDAAAKGLALHKAGQHGESIKVLHEAMNAYGIKH